MDFRVFPLGGRPPRQEAFTDECGALRLLCLHKLTEKQRDTLRFTIPSFSFEYIDPENKEYGRYTELVAHFRQLLEHYYRPEEKWDLAE
jgi:hypothetical protein